jgi:hypothetical protein
VRTPTAGSLPHRHRPCSWPGPRTGTHTLISGLINGPNVEMLAGQAVAQPGHEAAARRRAAFSRAVILLGCVSGLINAVADGVGGGIKYGLLDAGAWAVLAVLLAKPPRIRRSGRRLTLAFDTPGTLSIPAGIFGIFVGGMIAYGPDGIISALIGSVLNAVTDGFVLLFIQPPRALIPATLTTSWRQRLFAPITMLMGLPAAFAFGLATALMMVDTGTGDIYSTTLAAIAAGLLFFLITWPIVGLLVRPDPSDTRAIASPVCLV